MGGFVRFQNALNDFSTHKTQVCEISQTRCRIANMESIEAFKTPGQLIADQLSKRNWTNRLLAVVTGKEETSISKLVTDKTPVTADTALLLEEVFGIPAERFLSLQKSYDLSVARVKTIPDPSRAARASLFGGLPIQEMISRSWIKVENTKNVAEIESALTKFFNVNKLAEIETLPHAAKKTNALCEATLPQLAWLYRVRQIASQMIAPKYSEAKLLKTIPILKELLIAPEEARKVPKILAECGIRFVIVEALKSSKIDGVCCWLDKNTPVIAMTLRFDRMDNFWFVLRHELEHVSQGHGQSFPVIDTELESANATDFEEEMANKAGSEFCAPQARIDSFIARKAPLFPERDFLGLAKLLGVHPCLIAGQIRYKTGRYDLFNTHIVKIRSCVLPSAIVDGWGDIAPVDL